MKWDMKIMIIYQTLVKLIWIMQVIAPTYLYNKKKTNISYIIAPEYVIDNNICQANDMFSLGCLAYAVHNKGVSFLKTFNSFHTYERQIKSINTSQNIPDHLQQVIRSLLIRNPTQRMTPIDFQNSKYFDNLLVSTMKFLESFPEKTREEKAQFMKGLSRVLGQFPERVLKKKV
jgi:SCY1-like protein 2